MPSSRGGAVAAAEAPFTRRTATRTVATTTSTTLVNVVNKTTGGGVIYAVAMEDLDASAGSAGYKLNDIDAYVAATQTYNTGTRDYLNVITSWSRDVHGALSDQNAHLGGGGIWFEISFNWQHQSHTAPTSGVRTTIPYGDPNGIGHEFVDAPNRIRLGPFDAKVKKIESAWLIREVRLKPPLIPEINHIRENYSRGQLFVDFEAGDGVNIQGKIAQLNAKLMAHIYRPFPTPTVEMPQGNPPPNDWI